MSGLEVIGAISAVIAILDSSIKVYDSAQKDLKLSETFKTVRSRLPVLLETLKTCASALQPVEDSLPVDVCEALETILTRCDKTAGKLREIFEKVLPGKADKRQERYVKIVRRLGKGNKVEELMVCITEDIQLVVNHHAVKSAGPEQTRALEEIIKEMRSVQSSLPEEEDRGMTFNSEGGALTNYFNKDNGQLIINHAAVNTQNFVTPLRDDLSFKGPVGIRLGRVPCIDSELFVGRDTELIEMKAVLQAKDPNRRQRRLILGGPGGMGKTQLAIAFATQHYREESSVFWIDASSEDTVKDSFRIMADTVFDMRDPEILNRERGTIHMNRWLSDKQNTRWLLIFDNHDDPESYAIEKYYPNALHGSIIITTRRPDLVGGRSIRLQPLQQKEDQLKILEARSHRKNVKSDPHAWKLAERLGGLPLALATAGAYLRRSTFSFERYLQEYEQSWNVDRDWSAKLPEYERTLYTTWDISYNRLKNANNKAARLLGLMAYFSNRKFWYELFQAGRREDLPGWLCEATSGEVAFESVMGTLTDYCFLEVQASTASWSMHTCVHDWALATLNQRIDKLHYWYAVNCVGTLTDEKDFGSLADIGFIDLAAHAHRLEQICKGHGNLIEDVTSESLLDMISVARLLQAQVQLVPAEEMYVQALEGLEETLGLRHGETLSTVEWLGLLYKDQGKLKEAEEMMSRALRGLEDTVGAAHASTLSLLSHFSLVYRDQGKLKEAEEMLLRALRGFEEALGPEHTLRLNAAVNLGLVYRDQGKLKEAEEMLLRALRGFEEALGPEHTSTLNAAVNLGSVYEEQGKLKEAEEMLLRALRGYEEALGPEHTSTLTAAMNLGNVYEEQGKLKEAEEMLLRALRGYEEALGPEHTSTLNAALNLGSVYKEQGKLKEAEEMWLRALRGYEEALGLEHTLSLTAAMNLGIVYEEQGKPEKAEETLLRALRGFEEALGPEHTSTLNAAVNLGSVYEEQGKLKEAEEMLLRALRGYEEALGLEHPSTLNTAMNLGLLYRDQGKMEEAEKMYVQSLRGSENVWGPEHMATLEIAKYMATVYRNRARTYHVLEMKSRLRISSQVAAGRDISRKQILPLIIHLCSRYSLRDVSLLGIAGRMLLWIGDRENSQLAFQNQITMTGDGWSHGQTLCDSCEEELTMKTGRFVCMACSDVDLCEACHRQYDVLDVIEEATTGCAGHQFFAILQPDTCPTKSSNDERLSAWMKRMLQRYPVVPELERS